MIEILEFDCEGISKLSKSSNNPEKVKCEFCGKEIPNEEHLRCRYCGKYVCSDDARWMAVYVDDYPHRRLRSMRVCPNCVIKPRHKLLRDKEE